MDHTQQPIVSGVGMGSTAFPTLAVAKQLTLKQLQHLYGPIVSQKKAGPFAGSFNTVDIHTIEFGGGGVAQEEATTKKIAVRTGKEASFALLPSGAYSPGGGPVAASHLRTATAAQHTAHDLEEEARQSENNWVVAHKHNLSPALYFYGYVTRSANPSRLYLCAISEAFDSDLFDFYNDDYPTADGATQANIDIMVRTQLTNLFDKLARMGMLCFDIKPGNTVINYKEYIQGVKPLTVKLIDWDADWCLKQRGLAKGRRLGVDMQRQYYGFFMDILIIIFLQITSGRRSSPATLVSISTCTRVWAICFVKAKKIYIFNIWPGITFRRPLSASQLVTVQSCGGEYMGVFFIRTTALLMPLGQTRWAMNCPNTCSLKICRCSADTAVEKESIKRDEKEEIVRGTEEHGENAEVCVEKQNEVAADTALKGAVGGVTKNPVPLGKI